MSDKPDPAWFAGRAIEALERTAAEGLEQYDSIDERLVDWWSDLPWSGPERAEAVRLILADERFGPLAEALGQRYGLDLRAELREAERRPDTTH